MSVSQFTLIPPQIKIGDLFRGIETVIPQRMISSAISETNGCGQMSLVKLNSDRQKTSRKLIRLPLS